MTLLDEMPINEAIELYYEKHHALRQGDMNKLIELKKRCPEIFIKVKDQEILSIINYAKKFQASERYKELLRLEVKKTLTIIKKGD